MMIDGIPNRPLYFYQKDILGQDILDEPAPRGDARSFRIAGCYSIALLSYISVRVVREYKKPKAVEEAEDHAGARFMWRIC